MSTGAEGPEPLPPAPSADGAAALCSLSVAFSTVSGGGTGLGAADEDGSVDASPCVLAFSRSFLRWRLRAAADMGWPPAAGAASALGASVCSISARSASISVSPPFCFFLLALAAPPVPSGVTPTAAPLFADEEATEPTVLPASAAAAEPSAPGASSSSSSSPSSSASSPPSSSSSSSAAPSAAPVSSPPAAADGSPSAASLVPSPVAAPSPPPPRGLRSGGLLRKMSSSSSLSSPQALPELIAPANCSRSIATRGSGLAASRSAFSFLRCCLRSLASMAAGSSSRMPARAAKPPLGGMVAPGVRARPVAGAGRVWVGSV
mmetsp:Transcript_18312/g.61265  ORF Transcript_18312/g.61265 Transcript_18312/m.61265 type:complete len:320 (-) Transcript_18312:77-1036(-)